MQALILAGGRGKRLRPLTDKFSKVLLPVAGKPFLFYQINYFKNQGIDEFILAVGYKKQGIKDWFGNGKRLGVKIIYSKEKRPLDTGGAVKNAENLLKDKDILILNGDSFLELDIKKMLKFHKEKRKPVTIATKRVKNASRYGQVLVNKSSIITKFQEKSKKMRRGFISAGVYIFQKKILRDFPKDKKMSLEREIFPKFINKIAAFKTKGYFIDVGIPEDYQKADKDFKKYDKFN